jgi:hypothetical protein
MFFVMVFRKAKGKNDEEHDHYDDGKPLNQHALSTWDFNEVIGIINLKLNFVKFIILFQIFKNRKFRLDAFNIRDEKNTNRLTKVQVEALRKKRVRETIAKKALMEIAIYSCFIWVQFVVAFSNTDSNAFSYRNHLEQLIDNRDQVCSFIIKFKFNLF